MRPLPAYQNTLVNGQRAALQSLLTNQAQAGDVSSAIADLLADQAGPLTTYRPATEGTTISAAEFDAFLRSILVDLAAGYSETTRTQGALASVLAQSRGVLAGVLNQVEALASRVRGLEVKAEAEEGSLAFSFDFNEAEDPTAQPQLYEGRWPALLTQDEGLTLSPEVDHSYTITADAGVTATVTIVNQLGQSLSLPETAVSHCLNGDLDDFWMSIVQTDAPILASNLSGAIDWLAGTQVPFTQGAAAKLCFSFGSQVTVSEIVLHPVAPFPLQVLNVEYTSTGSSTVHPVRFQACATSNKIVLSLLDPINGTPFVSADSISVTLCQPTHTLTTYLVDRSRLVGEKYLSQLASAEASATSSYLALPQTTFWNEQPPNPYLTDGAVNQLQEWSDWIASLYQDLPSGDSELLHSVQQLGGILLQIVSSLYQLSQLQSDTESSQRRQHEYVLGLREVHFRYREYGLYARYVSQPLALRGADGRLRGEIRAAKLSYEAAEGVTVTTQSSALQGVTFWLQPHAGAGTKVLLPGDGSEVSLDALETLQPIPITDHFLATNAAGQIQLSQWPFVDFERIHTLTHQYYPEVSYDPNRETYLTPGLDPLMTIARPIGLTILTPSGTVIPVDETGAAFLAQSTPTQVTRSVDAPDNTILEEISVSEVTQLFSDPQTAATLSDLGFSAAAASLELERKFFRSRYRNWVPGTSFKLAVYYDNGTSTTDYTAVTLPKADVLSEQGILVFRSAVPRVLRLGTTDVDLLSGLQVKAYDFYCVPQAPQDHRAVPFTQNRTDYLNGYVPDVTGRPFDNQYTSSSYYPVVAYTHQGNVLQLNRVFAEEDGYQIAVMYRTLRQQPRLVVDLRRVADTAGTVLSYPQQTPRVLTAHLHLKVIRV